MSEEECHSGGGYGWYNYTYIDNVESNLFNDSLAFTAVRYCCGLCSEFFNPFLDLSQENRDHIVYSCACPAFGTEIQIRNNVEACGWPLDPQNNVYPLPNPPTPNSITCGQQSSFTTPPPTFAPTLPPTVPRIGAPVCWEYDDDGCYSTGTWCSDSNFIAVSNYTVNPIPFYTIMRAATIDEIEGVADKSFLNYAGQQLLQANSIDTTCWCNSPSIDWLPYGMIPYAETRLDPVPESIDVGAIPELPRAFHRGYTEGGLYLHTVGGIQLFGAVVNTNIGVTVGGVDESASLLTPTADECENIGCTVLETSEYIVELDYTACRFVCLDIDYAPNHLPVAPLRVTWLRNVTTSFRCHGSWINARYIQPLLLRTFWQTQADLMGLTSPRIQKAAFDLDVVRDCKLPGIKFCSIDGVGVKTVGDFCAKFGTSTFGVLERLNYSGFRGLTCEGNSDVVLNAVYPKIHYNDLMDETHAIMASDEKYLRSVRTTLGDVSWHAMLINENDCDKTITSSFALEGNTYGFSFGTTWVDLYGAFGCIGMNGCSDFSASDCNSVPGCFWRERGTSTSTTSTHTFGPFDPQTFSPTAKPSETKSVEETTNRDSAIIAAWIFIGLAAVVALFYIIAPTAKGDEFENDEDEELNPLII